MGQSAVSRAVCSWQAIGHARRVSGSSPMAHGGGGVERRGGSCPAMSEPSINLVRMELELELELEIDGRWGGVAAWVWVWRKPRQLHDAILTCHE